MLLGKQEKYSPVTLKVVPDHPAEGKLKNYEVKWVRWGKWEIAMCRMGKNL